MVQRIRRLALRLAIVALALIAVLYGVTRAYVQYEVHRAKAMLAGAERVQIGDSEASVLVFVQRYGGYKWTPERREDLSPRENWLDQWAYEHRLRTLPDHIYTFEVSPWRFLTVADVIEGRTHRLDSAVRTAMNAVPSYVRGLFGVRDWSVDVVVSVRGGSVSSVSGNVLVEGRSRPPGADWTGYEWRLASEMPQEDLQSRSYAVDSGLLEMHNGGGSYIQTLLTPEASQEQVQTAHTWNAGCLTSIRTCNTICDLSPLTARYLSKHPDAGPHVIPPKCQ